MDTRKDDKKKKHGKKDASVLDGLKTKATSGVKSAEKGLKSLGKKLGAKKPKAQVYDIVETNQAINTNDDGYDSWDADGAGSEHDPEELLRRLREVVQVRTSSTSSQLPEQSSAEPLVVLDPQQTSMVPHSQPINIAVPDMHDIPQTPYMPPPSYTPPPFPEATALLLQEPTPITPQPVIQVVDEVAAEKSVSSTTDIQNELLMAIAKRKQRLKLQAKEQQAQAELSEKSQQVPLEETSLNVVIEIPKEGPKTTVVTPSKRASDTPKVVDEMPTIVLEETFEDVAKSSRNVSAAAALITQPITMVQADQMPKTKSKKGFSLFCCCQGDDSEPDEETSLTAARSQTTRI